MQRWSSQHSYPGYPPDLANIPVWNVPKAKAPENNELNRTIRQPVSENEGQKIYSAPRTTATSNVIAISSSSGSIDI
jgi:hypothetical protein